MHVDDALLGDGLGHPVTEHLRGPAAIEPVDAMDDPRPGLRETLSEDLGEE